MTVETDENKALILVVDDAPDNILLLTTILEPFYRIKVAINGQRALKIAFGEDPPDLILLDVMMPDMDGYEVCRRLQADEKIRDIPVIFVTARTESADEVQGLALGAVDYISKPVMPPVVLARIRTHLALKRARAEMEQLNSTLQHEKEVVENIVAKMHRAAPFDNRHVRYHLSSVDRTAGDMVFSAYGPEGQQHVMVGDFSGHGLPAAVAGPMVSYIFYQLTAAGKPLEVILAEINRTLQRQLPIQIYMAACAVEVTADRQRATFWNHGLPPTLLLNRDGVKQRIAATEMPLGIIDPVEITPSAAAVKLVPGDHVFIFSDGMTEITSREGEEFGQPRLEPLLVSLAATREPLQSIWAALIAHRGGTDFPDDATLLEIAASESAP